MALDYCIVRKACPRLNANPLAARSERRSGHNFVHNADPGGLGINAPEQSRLPSRCGRWTTCRNRDFVRFPRRLRRPFQGTTNCLDLLPRTNTSKLAILNGKLRARGCGVSRKPVSKFSQVWPRNLLILAQFREFPSACWLLSEQYGSRI